VGPCRARELLPQDWSKRRRRRRIHQKEKPPARPDALGQDSRKAHKQDITAAFRNRVPFSGSTEPHSHLFPSRTRKQNLASATPPAIAINGDFSSSIVRLGLIRMFFASRHIPYRRMAP
jgi:hypothetical protein